MNDFRAFMDEMGISEQQLRVAEFLSDDGTPSNPADVMTATSEIHGIGLFSARAFNSGECVATALHDLRWTEAGRFANHAKEPNMDARPYERGLNFYARVPINPREELTVNYRSIRDALKNQTNHHYV